MDVMFLLILMTQFIGSLAQPDLQQQAAVNRQRSQHSLHLNLPKHNRGNSVENQGLPNQKSGQKVEFNYQRQDQPRQKPNNVAQIWLGKKKRKSIHQLKVNEPVVSGIPSIGGLPKTPIGLQNGQDKHKLKTGGIFNRVGSQDHAAGDSQYRRANRAEGDGRVDARKSLRRFGGVQSGAVHDLHLSPDTGAQVQGRALELENNRVRPQNSLRHQRPLPSTPSPEKVVNSDEATNEEDDLKSQQDNRDIAPPRRGDLPPDGNNQSPQQSLSGNLNNGGNYGGNIKNFQRGVIRTVEDNPNGQPMVDNGRYVQQQRHPANDGNFQNFNGAGVNINVPPQQSSREIGGIRLTWDWSDFAVTFDDYGGSELKVRRAPHATTGEPWPLPQYYVKKEKKI